MAPRWKSMARYPPPDRQSAIPGRGPALVSVGMGPTGEDGLVASSGTSQLLLRSDVLFVRRDPIGRNCLLRFAQRDLARTHHSLQFRFQCILNARIPGTEPGLRPQVVGRPRVTAK